MCITAMGTLWLRVHQCRELDRDTGRHSRELLLADGAYPAPGTMDAFFNQIATELLRFRSCQAITQAASVCYPQS